MRLSSGATEESDGQTDQPRVSAMGTVTLLGNITAPPVGGDTTCYKSCSKAQLDQIGLIHTAYPYFGSSNAIYGERQDVSLSILDLA